MGKQDVVSHMKTANHVNCNHAKGNQAKKNIFQKSSSKAVIVTQSTDPKNIETPRSKESMD